MTLWDNIKCSDIRIIGIPEGGKRVKGTTDTLLREIRLKTETYPGPGSTASSKQDEPKETDTKTHCI